MLRKPLLMIILLMLFTTFTIYAQEETAVEDASESSVYRQDFWISLGGDTAFYNTSGLSYGGHFSFGYGSGSSIGLKASAFFNREEFTVLELDLLLRFYLFGKNSYWGPFIQFMGGAALINYPGGFSIPSNTGVINAGLCFGWRYIYVDRFFFEPDIRLGYPYFLGLGFSAGIRF